MYDDDPDYAAKRLNGTLVRLISGTPFLVSNVSRNDDGVLGVSGRDLVSEQVSWVKLSGLNLEPVPLGFVNLSGDMVFTCRKPMRKDWKQGLSSNSLVTYGRLSASEINFKTLAQPILNQYPSYARALYDIKKRDSIAFCRDFGLSRVGLDITLVFRCYSVGKVEGNRAILNHDKAFLQQHLEEVI